MSKEYRGRGVICFEITNNPNQKFNAVPFDIGGSVNENDPKLDAPTKQVLVDNLEQFQALGYRVGRMHSRALNAGSGVTFAVAPGMLRIDNKNNKMRI